jgi:hypothetical protein
MKRTTLVVMLSLILGLMVSMPAIAEEASNEVKFLANTTLAEMGKDDTIVQAVKEQNKKMKSLKGIKEMDNKWKAEKGVADYMQALMDNKCAQRLKTIVAEKKYLFEIFVMDNMGANVCQTDKTGDYWQGDEAKFVKAYNGGRGGVFVDEVEVDNGKKVCQVSVPVVDRKTDVVVGAMTLGVLVDQVK